MVGGGSVSGGMVQRALSAAFEHEVLGDLPDTSLSLSLRLIHHGFRSILQRLQRQLRHLARALTFRQPLL